MSDIKKQKFVDVMEDYLILKRAAREEAHILKLNRIGLEKDEKKLKDNAAKYVGLKMPQEYNH